MICKKKAISPPCRLFQCSQYFAPASADGIPIVQKTRAVGSEGRAQNIESTEKVGKGAILPFFLQITYGHSQLSIIGGECFFVVGGVRAFGG